jgi:hypothetical protein
MNETITVEEAISKGHRMTQLPITILAWGSFVLFITNTLTQNMSFWIFLIGYISGATLIIFWYIKMRYKWRLWAFDKVRNVHELKKRAIQENLIWPNYDIDFEMTAISSHKDKEKWSSIQKKFREDDLFQDDLSILNETIIYYSNRKNLGKKIIRLGCLAVGIYLLIKTDAYILGSVLSIIGAYFSFKEFKKLPNTEPQIILNDKGVKTISTEFFEWTQIQNEKVAREDSESNSYYLVYDHPDGTERLCIEHYETNKIKLHNLLIIYRGRNKKKTTNS